MFFDLEELVEGTVLSTTSAPEHCTVCYMCSSRALSSPLVPPMQKTSECPLFTPFSAEHCALCQHLHQSTVLSTTSASEHCPLCYMCSSRAQCLLLAPSIQKTSECPLSTSFAVECCLLHYMCTVVLCSLLHLHWSTVLSATHVDTEHCSPH